MFFSSIKINFGLTKEQSTKLVQKLALHQNGVEFRQKSTGAIRCSVATSYDDVRRRTV